MLCSVLLLINAAAVVRGEGRAPEIPVSKSARFTEFENTLFCWLKAMHLYLIPGALLLMVYRYAWYEVPTRPEVQALT